MRSKGRSIVIKPTFTFLVEDNGVTLEISGEQAEMLKREGLIYCCNDYNCCGNYHPARCTIYQIEDALYEYHR